MKYFLVLFLTSITGLSAQNTMSLKEGETSSNATISEIEWMTGHWKGEAFGGSTEEIWSPPAAASMVFIFRLIVENKIVFYEIGHIRELGSSLVFELKHFGPDLKGWEAKEEVQTFKFIIAKENRMYFEGFTFERISDQEINIYGLIKNEDGSAEEVKFNYKKN
ncbi:MAG: hypothetical protein ACJAU2_001944 [Maribacter sp.]|jgi:hypothetical protein